MARLKKYALYKGDELIAHFIHEKCGYRESFLTHALACGIISIKEMK